ncbi:Sdh7p Ecym_1050 [Eremothecium cymbalariae DBVPG|uniref:Succinate dehydrogenase assembly factor 3 n=1 Tax=Eremothecium cymbalariae (strain CBS 270.75 / DBVPG 7215 / KCTC 17166 / NRRL Y-17582) TaxID=931890 RepID=G8JM99_ERECY|nr:hypothetical protein Ecym_1050 [Eremothecium cymbalariae DBVPG\
MKTAFRLLLNAHRSAARSNNRPLTPPLHLYRRILREHRNLLPAQRLLGDEYVKNEFRLHKNTENPIHVVGFLASWQDYLHMISNGAWEEGTLSTSVLAKLSSEQIVQLYELMKETQNVFNESVTNEVK